MCVLRGVGELSLTPRRVDTDAAYLGPSQTLPYVSFLLADPDLYPLLL